MILAFVSIWAVDGVASPDPSGRHVDLWFTGMVVNHGLTWVQTLRLVLEVKNWNWIIALAFAVCHGCWYIGLYWFSNNIGGLAKSMKSEPTIGLADFMSNSNFWLTFLLSVTMCMLIPFGRMAWQILFRPLPRDICRELRKTNPENYLDIIQAFTQRRVAKAVSEGGARTREKQCLLYLF